MKTPIIVFVFNRPNHAKQIRACLESEQDRDLYLVVDGARENKSGEAELVSTCINVFEDWAGQVQFNISDKNLGCKARISSGLDWVFKYTERVIILEDDLSPNSQFFQFCDEMLEAYADAQNVMSVCGTKTFPDEYSVHEYCFSRYSNPWGWATWKRAWDKYEDQFDGKSRWLIFQKVEAFLESYKAAFYWLIMLMLVSTERRNSWAYCWMISCFLNKGLHIYPRSNLVVNSGFGIDSTHTTKIASYMPQMYGKTLDFPIETSNIPIQADNRVDRWIDDNIYSKSMSVRLKWISEKKISGIWALMTKKH